jgi:RNA polymerase sigma factor (sigma-70 family)
MTQADLLSAYATRRDPEAFAQIVSQYQRFIFATCRRRLQSAEDIDDAVQETFLRLAQKAGELHTNIGGWLHTCAVNVTIDLNRRRLSRQRHESATAAPPSKPADNEQQELTELREHLDAALERLSPEQRDLIVQRYFVGRQQIDLAAEAKVAPSTITHRLDRAIEQLRHHLKTVRCVAIAAGGTAVVANLLEAETASAAAVPAPLTANVMKFGLSGVPHAGTAAAGALATSTVIKALIENCRVLISNCGCSTWTRTANDPRLQ